MNGLGKNSPEKTPFSRGISHVEIFRTQGYPKFTGNTTMVVLEKFGKPGEFAIFAAQGNGGKEYGGKKNIFLSPVFLSQKTTQRVDWLRLCRDMLKHNPLSANGENRGTLITANRR
jgi:hypothetical protein